VKKRNPIEKPTKELKMSSRLINESEAYTPHKTTRSERIMHRQNVIAAAQAAAANEPKRALNGPVRRWERKWVQVAGTMKVLKWVPGEHLLLMFIWKLIFYLQLNRNLATISSMLMVLIQLFKIIKRMNEP
jgi:hypothetical protein